MDSQYLFNSSGEWIAFRQGQGVLDRRCNWIGWLPWDDNDVAGQEGEYLGTIVDANRFYHLGNRRHRSHPGDPARPAYPAYPASPAAETCAVLPVGATDVASV